MGDFQCLRSPGLNGHGHLPEKSYDKYSADQVWTKIFYFSSSNNKCKEYSLKVYSQHGNFLNTVQICLLNPTIKTRFTLEEIVPDLWRIRERFSTGLLLPFTRKWTNPKQKLPGLAMSPDILNPEFKMGTLNPIVSNPVISPPAIFWVWHSPHFIGDVDGTARSNWNLGDCG